MPEIPAKNIHAVQSSLIGRDAKSCRGTFLSGSIEDDAKDGTTVRAFTSCQSAQKNWTLYYLAVPRKAGGIYVILTGTRGASEKPAKAADANIRQAVFKAVPQ